VSIVEYAPERAVQVAFAGLMLFIAYRMVRTTPAGPDPTSAADGR
jgi:uncharacterized membrane protein YfcA